MFIIQIHQSITLLLVLGVFFVAEVKSDHHRVKRQSRRSFPRTNLNETSIIVETEKQINSKTNNGNGGFNTDKAKMISTYGGIYTQAQFLIESPGYPSNYPNNANCLYIFNGPYCQTNYSLQFLDFNLEDSLGCFNDRLEIKIRDALCGSKEGFEQYTTSTGALELNFVSNGDTTARGFRILVSRSVCLNNPSEEAPITTMKAPLLPPTLRPGVFIPNQFPVITSTVSSINRRYLPSLPSPPPNRLYPNAKEPSCCAATYSDKRFFISSPGFPHASNTSAQCSFTILRTNPKVCRIRIQMHYFWVGEQDSTCSRGYLQIDGKLICGCHTGLKIVSPFDGNLGNTKVFHYMNMGLYFNGHPFTGFALEVIQDECPKRYLPDSSDVPERQAETLPRFNFYQDKFNRVGFPNITHEALLSGSMLNRNTEILEAIDLGFKPRVVKHVYYFDSPDYTYDVGFTYNKPRDVEETNYVQTVDLHALYPSGTDLGKCTSWNSNEWNQLNKDVAWLRMPKCNDIFANNYVPTQSTSHERSGCKEYSLLKGYFQSPGYPYYYPKHLNCCYRFYKQRGFCRMRLIMLDFNIEDSYDCRKDYLLIHNNFRYCGQSLANTFILFDLSGKSYEQIRFVTNDQVGGRGFRGIYEHIPCLGEEIPIASTTPVPLPSTRPTPNVPCLRDIKDDYFTIDIYDYGKDMCNFDVYRANPSICRLEVTFITFNLSCDLEFLQINGKQYCGNLSGQIIYIQFENNRTISIVYMRTSYKRGAGSGLKLHLVGKQSSVDCNDLPPVERILNQAVHPNDNKIGNMSIQIVEKINDVSVVLRKKYPEVCGIVMSVKDKQNAPLCDMILNKEEIVKCSSISENTIYVPYKDAADKLELKFQDVETVQEIEFLEITCDNKFIL